MRWLVSPLLRGLAACLVIAAVAGTAKGNAPSPDLAVLVLADSVTGRPAAGTACPARSTNPTGQLAGFALAIGASIAVSRRRSI